MQKGVKKKNKKISQIQFWIFKDGINISTYYIKEDLVRERFILSDFGDSRAWTCLLHESSGMSERWLIDES